MDDDRTLEPFHDPDLEQPSGSVRSDHHQEAVVEVLDPHRVVECVEDVRVVDAMPAGARCDRRFAIHCSKVTCGCDGLRGVEATSNVRRWTNVYRYSLEG